MRYRFHMFFIITLVAAAAVGIRQKAVSAEDSALGFKWALAARIQSQGDEVVKITGDTALRSGDLFKIFISPTKNAYVYVYLLDSSNHLSLLFPASIEDFNKNYRQGEKYYVPEGKNWFALDQNTGDETFHVLASAGRLARLEELTKKYLNAAASDKERAKMNVLAEIKDLKRLNSKFASNPEKPVQIAGSFRGDFNIEKLATETAATGFFAKTIRIEHK